MGLAWKRASLAIMIVVSAVVGFWAYFAPRDWYENFPGLGLSWLPQLGPYNEHLASDTGALYLGLAVLSALTLWRVRNGALVRATGTGLLVFNVLHFVFHMRMLHVYGPLDRGLNVFSLGVLVLASVVLVLPTPRTRVVR